ncbi:MAG: hypothetical protein Ta2G_07030 [Termitinemataceae bacterium]|nr:MAG: hypothetical protein Ta2G_07030 [Termitinemataceae bacterium]
MDSFKGINVEAAIKRMFIERNVFNSDMQISGVAYEIKYDNTTRAMLDRIRLGQSTKNIEVENSLKILEKQRDLAEKYGAKVPACNDYKPYIDYLARIALIRAVPESTGPIESANKTVVQKRCKQPGMGWLSENAQKMLSLWAKQESGLWESSVSALLAAA